MTRRNPFPGMNPWMQLVWSDVHTRLVGYIADALEDELPGDLAARTEERVELTGPLPEDQVRRVDVAVLGRESWREGRAPVWTPAHDPGLADRVAEPVIVRGEDPTPRWVEVRTAKGRLITVIEVTSPANKTTEGRAAFERKVRDLLASGVHVMEIDLVRGGQAAGDVRPGLWPSGPCQVIVNRGEAPGVAEVYPCPLRKPLPAVRVPLRPGEPDAALDLQPLIDRCHEKGRYWMLPYAEDPPAMAAGDLEWAREIVRAAGSGAAS